MQAEKAASGLGGVVLSVVDILSETNRTLVASDSEAQVLRGAFGVTAQGQVADLGPLISRKKQIVPALEAYFSS